MKRKRKPVDLTAKWLNSSTGRVDFDLMNQQASLVQPPRYQWSELMEQPHSKLPFENIVFEGGGVKGLAYIGALKALEDVELYPNHIKRFAGASAGSLTATLACLGYSAKELQDLFFEINLLDLVQDARFGKLGVLRNMMSQFGFHPGLKMLNFLGELFEERCEYKDVTFKQLYEWSGRELCIPITNLSRMCTEYCHLKTTPHKPVRLALAISMALPMVMRPYRLLRKIQDTHLENLYTDGGMLCNFPIQVFDGWWLSMKPEDTFLNRLYPYSAATEQAHDRVRFQPSNSTTIGFTVFSANDTDVTSNWACHPDKLPVRPETKLAKRNAKELEIKAKQAAMAKALEGSFGRLLDTMTSLEQDGDGQVSRDECQQLLSSDDFDKEDALRLFGTTDLEQIFSALDINDDGQIRYTELLQFIDGKNADVSIGNVMTGHKEIPNLTKHILNIVDTLCLQVSRASLQPTDQHRTVPINTDYIATEDFGVESADKDFLVNCGEVATREFLRAHVA